MNAPIFRMSLLAVACMCMAVGLRAQQIVQAEYFFDTDLGVGQNPPLTIVPGDTVLFSSAVPVTGLTPGYHYLYVRIKDENDQWSTTLVKRLYIYDNPVPSIPPPAQIVEAEYYFLNADPGPGNGVDIPLSGADTVEVTATISSNQFMGGVLPLNIRVRDSNGNWSYCSTDTVYKNGALLLTIANRPLVRVNSLERFAFTLNNGGYAGALESFLLIGVQDTLEAYIDDHDDGDIDSALWSMDHTIDFDGFNFTLIYLDSVAPQSSHDFSLFHRMPSSPGGSEHRAALVTNLSEDIRPHEHAFRHDKLVDLLGRAYDSGRDSLSTDFLLTREEFEDSAETWLQSLAGQSQYNVLALVDTLYSLHCGVCDPAGQGLFRQAAFTILLRYSGLRDDDDEDMLGSQAPEIRSSSDGPQLGPCEPIPDKEPVCRNDSPDGAPPCDDCPNPPNPPCPLAVPLLPGPFPTTSDFCEPRCRPTHDKNTREPLDPKPPQRHGSWDIGAPEGTIVYAPFDGNITSKNTTSGFCGRSLTIQAWCDPSLKVKFCHLQTILQSSGGVIGGMPIATVGKTGDVPDNRPHLHAEVSYNGTLENPFCMPMFSSVVSNHPPGPQVYNDCLQCTEGRTKSEYGSIPRCAGPTVAVSIDPNIKLGPIGYDTAHFVNGSTLFTYDVLFENLDSAVVPAQYVAVRDTIDVLSFDMSTFRHDVVALGYELFMPDTSLVLSYQDTLDTRSWNSVFTALAFTLDTLTGAAQWSFQALDTATLQPVTDPFVGVLPPDTLPPTGSGAIRFHLRLRDAVGNGAVVSNEASIYFDTNPPIITPPWNNTVDRQAPSSEVLSLPGFTTDTLFEVHWSGTDNGQSGIEFFDTYYAVNQDTLFEPWLQVTSDTVAIFEGEIGNTYYFYSVAVDSVGNREEEGIHFDAFTTVTISTPIGSYQDADMNLSLFPNPTTGAVSLRGRIDSGCRLGVVVRNAVGQELLTKTIGVGPGPIMEQVDLSRLAVGTYFVTVNCNDSKLLERLIKITE